MIVYTIKKNGVRTLDSMVLVWFEENSGRALTLNEIASEVEFRISDIALLNSVTALVKSGAIKREISKVNGKSTTQFVHKGTN